MVNLASNEQWTALYPLTAHYSIWPFPTSVIFRPSQGPFILGLISIIQLLKARHWPFLPVGQIQPAVTNSPLLRRAIFLTSLNMAD